MATFTIASFALALGQSDRVTMEASAPLAKAYAKADKEARTTMRAEFIVSYLEGNLKVTGKKAAAIFEMERAERSEDHQKAVMRAAAKFNYHIIRDAAGSSGSAEPIAVPRALLSAVKALKANGYTDAQIKAALKRA